MKDEDKAPSWMVALLLVLTPAFVVWRGYAMSLLWAWLIVPTFDVRPLTIAQALAVSFVARVVVLEHKDTTPDLTVERVIESAGRCVFAPAFFILLAWVYRSFLPVAP